MAVTPTLTLVAIHGNGGGAFRFARVKPLMPPDIRFRPVTLPGFATVPPLPELQTLDDYARYLHAMLAAEVRPLIILGHGIGGSIGLAFGQRYAREIDGLILHAPVGTRLERRLLPRLMALPGARRLGQWLFSARLPRPLFKRLLFSRPVPSQYLDRFFDEYRRCAVFGRMFDLITPAWFDSLQPLDVPAVLLWGEQERVLSVDQLADYKSLLPRHIVRTVPAWDHFPMIEYPAAYATELVTLARQLVASNRIYDH